MVLRRVALTWPFGKCWSSSAWVHISDNGGLRNLATKVDYFDKSCDRRIAPVFRVVAEKGPLSAKDCWNEIMRRKADAQPDDSILTNIHMVSKRKMKQALNWLKYKKWVDTKPSGFNKRKHPTGNFLYIVHRDRLDAGSPRGDDSESEETVAS